MKTKWGLCSGHNLAVCVLISLMDNKEAIWILLKY